MDNVTFMFPGVQAREGVDFVPKVSTGYAKFHFTQWCDAWAALQLKQKVLKTELIFSGLIKTQALQGWYNIAIINVVSLHGLNSDNIQTWRFLADSSNFMWFINTENIFFF